MPPPIRHHHPEVVSRAELLAAGWTPGQIRHAVRSGRLHPIHPGVYAIGRPQLTREGRWYAAVLAGGDGALLSHRSAAALWDLLDRGALPEVSIPGDVGRRGPRGIVLHRSPTLSPTDGTVRRRIPVTTLTRTLLDVARTADHRTLREAVRQAARLHRLDLVTLRAAAAAPRSSVGHARLFSLLAAYVPGMDRVESELEDRFLELCRRHRLPLPEPQVRVGRHRADFVWHEAWLVVEVDGRITHDTAVAFVEDRVKDRALKAAGFEVLRFTWSEVVHRAAAVAREVRSSLRRRRGMVGDGGSGALRRP